MPNIRDVTAWLAMIQDHKSDDLWLARELLNQLIGYRKLTNTEPALKDDLGQLLSVFAAIRIDQMAKEN